MASLNILRRSPLFAIFVTLLATCAHAVGAVGAEPSVVPARVTQQVDEVHMAPLKGNIHPLAKAEFDRGAAPVSMPVNRMVLVLKHSAEQEAALTSYLQAVHNSASPRYQKWLTPEEFGARFGVADADLATVESWLQGRGFTVNKVAKSRLAIEFSGNVGQVQSAFHTQIHSFVVNGEQHWANVTDPSIPAALATVVVGPSQLHNFAPRSQAIRGPGGRYNPKSGRIEPTYTLGGLSAGYYIFLGPADAATIYDTPNALNPNHPSTTYDGTGVTIGIAGDSNINVTQNANYRATFGLTPKATSVVVDGTDPGENGDGLEAYLDTEVAGGIAPNANIVLYTASNTTLNAGLFLAITRALDDNKADILNVSFGGCEAAQGNSGNQYIYALWEQAAAQGITVTVSSGDAGSAGCDNPDSERVAQYGLAVNGLGSTPYNVVVGGTDFDTLYSNFPSSFTNYVDVTNTLANHRSALKYIPEEPWNNSTNYNQNTTVSENVYSSNGQTIVGGGGGVSDCVFNNGSACTGGYAVPAWQASFATDGSGRNSPDVSLLAANGYYGAMWGLCTDMDSVPDCAGTPTTGNNFSLTGVGGTSASAPAFAGILALVEQKAGGRLGQADYALYDLAKTKYSTVFHDITTGNNSVNCYGGTANCVLDTAGYYFLSGYNTATGYDEASGLGSVDASQLVSNWASATFTPTTSALKLNGATSALTITHGATVNVNVGVTSGSGTPSGDVALVDSLTAATYPNNEGIADFTLGSGGTVSGTTNYLPGGAYNVTSHYGGSPTYAESVSNAVAVTVNSESSSTAVTVSACYDPSTGNPTSTTIPITSAPYGFYCYVDAEPYGNSASAGSPNGIAAGTITFTSGAMALGSAPLNANGVAEVGTPLLPGGTPTVTAAFPGDPSFKANTGTASFTVVPATTTASLTANESSVIAGTAVPLTASLTMDSLGAAPTGTVTFVSGTTTLGSVAVAGTAGTNTNYAGGQAQFTATLLPVGSNSITAVYNGDANYAASAISYPFIVNVGAAASTVTVTPASNSIKASQSLQVTISLNTISGLSAPSGTVTLSGPGTSGTYTSAATALSGGAASITIPASSLAVGTDALTVTYSGDKYYAAETGTASVQVASAGTATSTVSVTPGATNVSSLPLQIGVVVTGAGATPTGTVKLTSGSFASAAVNLVGGSATITLVSGNLATGTNVLTVSYSGDSSYASSTGTSSVFVLGYSVVTITENLASITTTQPLIVTVAVGTISPLAAPSGTVTLTSGAYSSGATALTSGSATITIPASTFTAGTQTLSASYSGDANYNPTSGTGYVSVTAPVPGLSVSGTAVTVSAPGATTGNTSTITVTPTNGFLGQVTLSAAVTASPSGAAYLPTFTFTGNPITISGASAQTATVTVNTTAASSSAAVKLAKNTTNRLPAGGLALAGLLLLGVPARRRNWQSMLGLVVLLAALVTGAVACGGGGSSGGGGGGGGGISGTTTGAYTVTVTASSGSTTTSNTITVTVN